MTNRTDQKTPTDVRWHKRIKRWWNKQTTLDRCEMEALEVCFSQQDLERKIVNLMEAEGYAFTPNGLKTDYLDKNCYLS